MQSQSETCTNMHKLAKPGKKLIQIAQTGTNWHVLEQIGTILNKLPEHGKKLRLKVAHEGKVLHKPVKDWHEFAECGTSFRLARR